MNTINIKVKYTAQLKKSVGKGEELFEIQAGATVKEALAGLAELHKEAFLNIVFTREGEFLNAVLLILNGEQIAYETDTELENKDELIIMAPIAGG